MIKLMQQLPSAIKAVAWPVIQQNAYWAHHENVLLALQADSDSCNRELAIKTNNNNQPGITVLQASC